MTGWSRERVESNGSQSRRTEFGTFQGRRVFWVQREVEATEEVTQAGLREKLSSMRKFKIPVRRHGLFWDFRRLVEL